MRSLVAFGAGFLFVIVLAVAMEASHAASVWECAEGDESVWLDPVSGQYVGQCASLGTWNTHNPEFDPESLDPGKSAAALGAGFVVMGIGTLMAWVMRTIVQFVRNA